MKLLCFIIVLTLVLYLRISSSTDQSYSYTKATIGPNYQQENVTKQDDTTSKMSTSENFNQNKINYILARQLIMNQLFMEEKIRSDGNSGVKQTRIKKSGSKSYDITTAISQRAGAIHDHANNIRTIGMGEIVAVLNGIEFRTRHNDYRLYMPSTTSTDYKKVENIPFPPVPEAVLRQASVEEEIKEMREWFKAWKEQNYTVRDYRPYFKPVLCYLEGTWIESTEKLEESFFSDRHFLDAKSWHDMQEKIRYAAYAGVKSRFENYSFLPSSIMNVAENGSFELAQWNYRILCHPLKNDLPTANFRVVDDLSPRANRRRSLNSHAESRAARFQLDPRGEGWKYGERETIHGYLDDLMYEIPGMDNYPGNLKDDETGAPSQRYNSEPLNAGYYHRVYRLPGKDAMGDATVRRSFSDDSVFFAMNSQSKVVGPVVEFCPKRDKACYIGKKKWSYAIPLEIIYLTPLLEWNPYNVEYKGYFRSDLGRSVRTDGRNGGEHLESAYNGSNSKIFYRTPSSFFSDASKSKYRKDRADTADGTVAVLSSNESAFHLVQASGTRVTLPFIDGVGPLRLRYPIMPLHIEGNAIMKELEALKDMVSERSKFGFLYRERPSENNRQERKTMPDATFRLSYSRKTRPRLHTHRFTISYDELVNLKKYRGSILATTDLIDGHNHVIRFTLERGQPDRYRLVSCDGRGRIGGRRARCRDGHAGPLTLETKLP